jgi:magnesium-protoporphyrin O-methyltransferase
VLDAGCGTGLFSLALARRGFDITALDIAPQMVAATREQARAAGLAERVTCSSGDLESASGSFDAVVCFDVLVHYPRASFAQLCTHLASLTRGPLLMTYAPREPVLAALHWLGGRFPRGQRRTDIQMIPEPFVRATLAAAGMRVTRQARVSRGFYHVTLLEAYPAPWRTFLEKV